MLQDDEEPHLKFNILFQRLIMTHVSLENVSYFHHCPEQPVEFLTSPSPHEVLFQGVSSRSPSLCPALTSVQRARLGASLGVLLSTSSSPPAHPPSPVSELPPDGRAHQQTPVSAVRVGRDMYICDAVSILILHH